MSKTSTAVSPEHFEYLARRTQGDDSFLVELKEAARSESIPEIWVSPEQVSLMAILLKAARAKTVVEVGTLAGYSAIGMARALPDEGMVHSIELSPKHANFARRWIRKSDVATRIEVLEGSGDEWLPKFEDASVDAIFLDADKSGYANYIQEAMRFLRPGGLVLVDNAFAFGQLLSEHPSDGEVGAVRAFNDLVPTIAGLHAVIVPIGDGLWVGTKEQ